MKRIIITCTAAALALTIILSCTNEPKKTANSPKTLNISVYLDLSDRLVRDLQPNQTYRDTAIINYLCDYFKKQTLGPTILQSQNKMKVFFYPTPNNSEIPILAQGLNVDIASKQGVEKRMALDNMKSVFSQNLAQIYNETIKDKNWIGCDIWGFFSSKKVDNLCVKEDTRNIIVILTDGYLFHQDHKLREENAYSYILPQTLAVENSSLINRRKGELSGKGIEILMLEVNPYKPDHLDKMVGILDDWFKGMGIEKVAIAETDANLTNTQTIIKNFLEH